MPASRSSWASSSECCVGYGWLMILLANFTTTWTNLIQL